MNSKFGIAAVVVGFLVFTIGAARPANAAPPTDACSLLTPAQVSAVLGVSVKSHQGLLGDTAVCDFSPGSPAEMLLSKHTKAVEVKILDADTWTFYKRAGAPLKGIGDYAFYVFSGHPILFFKKGNSKFNMYVSGFPIDQAKAKEKTLALDILAKL